MSLARFRAQALVYIIHFRHERLRPDLRSHRSVPITVNLGRMPAQAEQRQQEATQALWSHRGQAVAELLRDRPGLPDPTGPLDAVVDAVRALMSLPTTCAPPGGPGGMPNEGTFVEAERRCFTALSLVPDPGAAFAVRTLLEAAGRVEALPGSLGDAAAFASRETAARRCSLAEELSAAREVARAAGLGGVVPFAEWDGLVGQFDAGVRGLLPLHEGDSALPECWRTVLDLRRHVEDVLRSLEGVRPAAAGAVLEDEALFRRARTNLAGADVERIYRDLIDEYRQTRVWTTTAYQQAIGDAFNRCVNRPGGELPGADGAPYFPPIASALAALGRVVRASGLGALWERVDEAATFQLNMQAYRVPPEAAACHQWAARLVGRALAGELTVDDIRQTWEEPGFRGSLGMAGGLLRGLAGEHPLAYQGIPVMPNGATNNASTVIQALHRDSEANDDMTQEILTTVRRLRAQHPAMKITQAKIAEEAVCSPQSVKVRTPSLLRQGKLTRTRKLGFSLPNSPETDPDVT
jgi:hypothetical protein